jgi:DNA-binding response OmpR family regulator
VTARSRRALIVDHDLGFLMWLGEVFSELGYETIPSLSCSQALALAKRFDLPIRTLVVDPEMSGAPRLIEGLAADNAGLQVVLLRDRPHCQNDTEQNLALPRNHTWLERPASDEPVSRDEWVIRIRAMLSRPGS